VFTQILVRIVLTRNAEYLMDKKPGREKEYAEMEIIPMLLI
jgi:hypothetical protein